MPAPLADCFSGLWPTRFRRRLVCMHGPETLLELRREQRLGPPALGLPSYSQHPSSCETPVTPHSSQALLLLQTLRLIMLKGPDTENPGLEANRGKRAEDQASAGGPWDPSPAPGAGPAAHASLALLSRQKPACQVPRRLGTSGAAPGPLFSPAATLALGL